MLETSPVVVMVPLAGISSKDGSIHMAEMITKLEFSMGLLEVEVEAN